MKKIKFDSKRKNNVQIVVARHCATMMNEKELLQGSWLDFPLSDKGKAQAQVLSFNINHFLKGKKPDMVICSKTQRAIETALFVSPNSTVLTDDRLLVYDIGTADASPVNEVYAFKGFPVPGIYHKMENPFKYYKRVKSFFHDLMFDPGFDGKLVLVVTHKDITALADHFLCGKKLIEALSGGQKNGDFKFYEIKSECVESNER